MSAVGAIRYESVWAVGYTERGAAKIAQVRKPGVPRDFELQVLGVDRTDALLSACEHFLYRYHVLFESDDLNLTKLEGGRD